MCFVSTLSNAHPKCCDVDLVHAAGAGEIQRVGSRRAHGNARAHHAHAGERGIVGIDAASGCDDIVAFGRHQTAERHIVHMILSKSLPDMTGAVVVQFDRPGRARNRVGKLRAGPDIVYRQLLATDDPAGLADAGKAVGADPRVAEACREFSAQEGNRAVGLVLAVQSPG